MNRITVEVKPYHLKGNSFEHGVGENKRKCPLDEALREIGYKPDHVGAFTVRGIQGSDYKIDRTVWEGETVGKYVEKANQGSQESVFVNLDKID